MGWCLVLSVSSIPEVLGVASAGGAPSLAWHVPTERESLLDSAEGVSCDFTDEVTHFTDELQPRLHQLRGPQWISMMPICADVICVMTLLAIADNSRTRQPPLLPNSRLTPHPLAISAPCQVKQLAHRLQVCNPSAWPGCPSSAAMSHHAGRRLHLHITPPPPRTLP